MILINLLPSEFRGKTKLSVSFWPNQKVARIGLVLFLGITGIFYLQYLFSWGTLRGLEKRWRAMQVEVQRADQVRQAMETGSKGERTFLEKYVLSPFPNTSVLTWVSETLPNSIWLVELKVLRHAKENSIVLKGVSLPSHDQSSVQEIERYLRDLKGKFPVETELVLTTSRQQNERAELTLFTAVFKWS